MEAFALYLFRSVVWLTGFSIVYLLFLRNERYFLLNRLFLLAGIMASILFPFFTWHYTVLIPVTPVIEVSDLQMTGIVSEPEAFPTKSILLYAYMAGALYLLFRIIGQTIKVIRVIRQSEILPHRSAKLIRTPLYPSSFSFFSFVFVNPSSSETETNEIVNHELEHVRQRHWIDLVLFELLCILQWLNPLCWLYGRFIRQNHEFLADQHALQRSANPAIYRAALLNQLFGGEVISLASSFSYSINKKRFYMMKNTINPPIRKLKLLLILPITAGVFYAFATPEYRYVQEEINPPFTILDSESVIENALDQSPDTLKGNVTTIEGNFKALTFSEGTKSSDFGLNFFHAKNIQGKSKGENKVLQGEEIAIDLSNTTKLIFIDGKEVTQADVDKINPNTIESVSVLKGESATILYGDKGKDGAVLISLKKEEGKAYKQVEQMPEFPGGETALRNFLASNIRYPAIAHQKGIQGKVFVTFIVDQTGKVVDPKIAMGVDPSLDKEALRVVQSMPQWKPGIQNGENVAVEYTIPINFVLLDDTKKNATASKEESPVYFIVEEMPQFPGGEEALRNFIASNVKYPAIAAQNGVQGKVYINFVVTQTGSIGNAKVARGVDPFLDQEAIRVVESMPAWIPGKQKGVNVRVSYTVPINFVLGNNKDIQAFKVVEEMPSFPGGEEALKAYIAASMKYPIIASENGIQGQVIIKFIVDKTGKTTNVRISRGVDPSLDKEAIRIVDSMPNWNPGKQNGENVAVALELPFHFKLPAYSKISKEKLHLSYQTGIKPENQAAETRKLICTGNGKNGQITYTLENSDYTGKVEVNIFDKDGKVVKKEIHNGPSFILDNTGMNGSFVVYARAGAIQYTAQISISSTTSRSKSPSVKKKEEKPTVNQVAPVHELIIVPNPTNDKAMITLKDSDYNSKLQVSVYNKDGKLIVKETKNGPTFSLSFARYTSGSYLIVVKAGNNQHSGHLVVNH